MATFPTNQFKALDTPFYYYDLRLLRETIEEIKRCAPEPNFKVHYAVKACGSEPVLKEIFGAGLGADCVSGGEISAALKHGAPSDMIVFAGVAKADWEIRLALEHKIQSFNVESVEELDNISRIAQEMGVTARVSIRINPNVDAHTHKKITTGLEVNKFGISMQEMLPAVQRCQELPNIEFEGLHFHIGSQITDFDPFRNLCVRINELVERVEQTGVRVRNINVGGGLGVSYEHPNHFPMPDFEGYFKVFRRTLHLRDDQVLHFELGRAVVAQCGSLITRVLYVKQAPSKQFVMVDAGMTDLIRPALYNAYHKIENLTADPITSSILPYDIVGPICESSDVFAENYPLPETHRGDVLAIRSAGAYGEIMASQYNMRRLPGCFTSDQL